jgi:rod shape-determining protein MreB
MPFSTLSRLRGIVADPDVAIDLGTANTRLYAVGRGLVADEPSLVAVDRGTGSVEAVGARAARIADSDASVRPVSPLRAGVISDMNAATSLLTPLLRRARRFGLLRPRVLVCAPTDAREDERAALVEATRRAGAAAVTVAPEPLAAAIGAGLDISSSYAQMIVDIGDGVTDIAVIRSGRLVGTSAVRTACSDLHAAVQRSVAEQTNVLLHAREAERLTLDLGAARGTASPRSLVAAGIDRASGIETSVLVSGQQVVQAIDPVVAAIVRAVRTTVSDLPATTACEVIESGICLTGGGARLRGLADLIATETALEVRPAADPMRAVIEGARQMLSVATVTGAWAS